MNRFARFFKEHRNKILATGFASLGVLVYLLHYLMVEIMSNWNYFRGMRTPDMILAIFSFAFCLFVYMTILVCNIRNEGAAYQGILMFVFYITFGIVFDFFTGAIFATYNVIATGSTGLILSYSSLLFSVGQVVVGILLYIYTTRYMQGVSVEWKKIRLLAILFSVFVTLGWLYYLAITISAAALAGSSEMLWLPFTAIAFSEVMISVSIIFTLERLRRY